jgi:hypothetical protein
MRERDTTHSYWYIPSAPRENYSLLIMETSGMMMMDSGDDSPSGRLPEKGLNWFSMDTEACNRGTSHLGLFLGILLFIGFFSVGITRRWATRRAQPTRARLGLLACPGGYCSPQASSPALLRSLGCLLVKKKSPKSFAAFGLRLVLIFYDVKKQAKNSNWHWALCP